MLLKPTVSPACVDVRGNDMQCKRESMIGTPRRCKHEGFPALGRQSGTSGQEGGSPCRGTTAGEGRSRALKNCAASGCDIHFDFLCGLSHAERAAAFLGLATAKDGTGSVDSMMTKDKGVRQRARQAMEVLRKHAWVSQMGLAGRGAT